MKIYRLGEAGPLCETFAHLLQSGMARRVAGALEVTRAGPFAPPISFPYEAVIVTASFKSALERSGLTGFGFRPAVKRRIVKIAWEKWGKKPRFLPKQGEPEDYLGFKHSREAARRMEDLFELVLEPGCELRTTAGKAAEKLPVEKRFTVDLSTYSGADFLRPAAAWFRHDWLVNERAKEWLEKNAGHWVSFTPLRTTGRPPATPARRVATLPAAVPPVLLTMSCGEEFVGAHAFASDSRHFGVEWRKGRLQVWDLVARKIVGEHSFAPLPGQKAPPALSCLALTPKTVFGVGSAAGKRYLLHGPWPSGACSAPFLLGKGIGIKEYDGDKQLCDQGAFSPTGGRFLWFSGHELSCRDLAQWPPAKHPLPVEGQVSAMAASRTCRHGAILLNGGRLALVAMDGNSVTVQHELAGNYQCSRLAFAGDDVLIHANLEHIEAFDTKDGQRCWRSPNRPVTLVVAVAPLKGGEWVLAAVNEKQRRDLFWMLRPSTGQIVELSMRPEDPSHCNQVYNLAASPDGEWVVVHCPQSLLFWRSDEWIKVAQSGSDRVPTHSRK